MSGNPALDLHHQRDVPLPRISSPCTTRARRSASSSSGRRAPGSPSSRSTAATACAVDRRLGRQGDACEADIPPRCARHGPRLRLRDPVGHALGAARARRRPLWDGRVFIAGDAAHRMSPTGGFGMNTGIQDASISAGSSPRCQRGWGGGSLLRSYEIERGRSRSATSPRRAAISAACCPASACRRRDLSSRARQATPRAPRSARWFTEDDEAGVVHHRLPPRLPLRRLADRLAGRHAGAADDTTAMPRPRGRGARAACLAAGRALDARPVRPRLRAAAAWAPMPGGERCAPPRRRRRAARGWSARRRRGAARSISAGSCWCGPTVTWPGAPTRNRDDARASPIACAGRALRCARSEVGPSRRKPLPKPRE